MARPGEATEAQRKAFSYALASRLADDRSAVSQLAAEVGVDRNTVYLWRSGKREPQRHQVFKIERAYGLPAGSLSHLLGYLPVGAWSVEASIAADARLSDNQKTALLTAYHLAIGG